MSDCVHGDALCPCQDGCACHYEWADGTPPMQCPRTPKVGSCRCEREHCARIAEAWAEHYPEDVFPPIWPPYTMKDKSYNQISAHASRHAARMIAKLILEDKE